MIITVDEYMAKEMMESAERDKFSLEALECIIEYEDENVEFDPVGICNEWDEYTPDELCDESVNLISYYEEDADEIFDCMILLYCYPSKSADAFKGCKQSFSITNSFFIDLRLSVNRTAMPCFP